MRQADVRCLHCETLNRVRFEVAVVGFECQTCCATLQMPESDVVAARQIRRVACGLYVTGTVSLVLDLFLFLAVTGGGQINDPLMEKVVVISTMACPLLALYTLYGAYCVQTVKRYGIAMSACVTAMVCLPLSFFIFGIPIGVWGAVVLCRPNVRAQFQPV